MKRIIISHLSPLLKAIVAAFLPFVTFSCAEFPYSLLRSGDLIFQANSGSDFVEAIEAVTMAGDSLMSFSHVGIIKVEGDKVSVIEATPEKGVCITPMEDFLRTSAHDAEGRPMVRVMRYTGTDAGKVCSRAISLSSQHLGKQYDFAFDPDMGTVYCSELVFRSFVDDNGDPLFGSNPMTFKDSTGKTSSLWLDYYAKLGKDIPEGAPGTNPNDMSREPLLETVPVVFP